MKRAEITVFLSMVFILLVSFVLGIVEISFIHTSKNMSRLGTDRAVFSIFGEYQKTLLEEYHIFAIEGSYGTGDFAEHKLIGRMHYYGTGQMDHEITDIQFLTDDHGQAFREQVLEYMEECYGIGIIRDFTGLTEEWAEQEIMGEKILENEKNVMDQYKEIKAYSETEDTKTDSFTSFEQIEKSGLLSMVMPEEMKLSGREIDLAGQVSERALNTGRGSFPARQGMDGIDGRLLFNEYILQKFTNASSGMQKDTSNAGNGENKAEEDGNRSLAYEVEYIISGKSSDKENLEAALMKIFLVRMALNYAYLLGDSGKQAEADVLAVTISALLLIPEGAEIVKQLILFAWAAVESMADIRTLLSGKRAALIKSEENWQTSLSELLIPEGSRGQSEGEDIPGGISYEEYLRAFLFMADQDDVAMRCLDRIEENLVSECGMDYFRADHCVTKLKMKNTALIFGNLTYTYPVYFGYE